MSIAKGKADGPQTTRINTDLSWIHALLECPICFEHLGNRSKVLPCQHTFCKSCLEVICLGTTTGYLQCPECRSEFRGTNVDSLPPNVFLERIFNELVKREDQKGAYLMQVLSVSIFGGGKRPFCMYNYVQNC